VLHLTVAARRRWQRSWRWTPRAHITRWPRSSPRCPTMAPRALRWVRCSPAPLPRCLTLRPNHLRCAACACPALGSAARRAIESHHVTRTPAQARCRRWCAASGRAASRAWRHCLLERRPRRCPRAPPRTPRAACPASARRPALRAALSTALQMTGPMRASSACALPGRTRCACEPALGPARRAAGLRALLARSLAGTPCAHGLARRLPAPAGARRGRACGPPPAREAPTPGAAVRMWLAGAARRGAAARL